MMLLQIVFVYFCLLRCINEQEFIRSLDGDIGRENTRVNEQRSRLIETPPVNDVLRPENSLCIFTDTLEEVHSEISYIVRRSDSRTRSYLSMMRARCNVHDILNNEYGSNMRDVPINNSANSYEIDGRFVFSPWEIKTKVQTLAEKYIQTIEILLQFQSFTCETVQRLEMLINEIIAKRDLVDSSFTKWNSMNHIFHNLVSVSHDQTRRKFKNSIAILNELELASEFNSVYKRVQFADSPQLHIHPNRYNLCRRSSIVRMNELEQTDDLDSIYGTLPFFQNKQPHISSSRYNLRQELVMDRHRRPNTYAQKYTLKDLTNSTKFRFCCLVFGLIVGLILLSTGLYFVR